jgi:hypothetical protein
LLSKCASRRVLYAEGFEAYVGNKTSMRLINAAWVLSYSRDVERKGGKGKLTLEEGVTLLGSRTDPWHFTRRGGLVQVDIQSTGSA